MIAKPVQESNRVHSLDVARGFALLGIFLVNIALMAAPLGELVKNAPMPGESVFSQTIYYTTKTLFEGKTYPLFSMLFGIGLAMQLGRTKRDSTNSSTAPYYWRIVRRQLALIVVGFLHVALLWYGDILFIYGFVGLAALLVIHLRARWLVLIASLCIAVSVLSGAGMGALSVSMEQQLEADRQSQAITESQSATETSETDPAATPIERLLAGFQDQSIQDPSSPGWIDAEIEVTTEGPFLQAALFRLFNWASFLVFGMVLSGGGLHIVAMFLLGAAIWKADLLGPGKESLRRKLAIGFGLVGVPVSAYIALVGAIHPNGSPYLVALMTPANYIFGPMISLMYLFGFAWLVDSGKLRPVTNALANAGRLALTNYLSQTMLASILFAFWGFGLFNTVDRPTRVVIVLSIFAAQLVFSALWLKAFKIGPLEWFLRSITYLHLPKLRRGPVQSD